MADTIETTEPVYRVLEGFSFDDGGRPWVMRKGDLVTPSHPAFAGREALLERVDDEVIRADRRSSIRASATERATAAPGEHRTIGTPMVDSTQPGDSPGPSPAPAPTPAPAPAPTPAPAPSPQTSGEAKANAAAAKGGKATKGRPVADNPQA